MRSSGFAALQRRGAMLGAITLFIASCTSAPHVAAPERAASQTTAAAVIRYDTVHHPVIASNGMVVSQNAIATRVGQQILADGGNAVDAAVAVGFALAVTLPRAGNIGGSGFMLVHLADTDETIALDYRSAAPAGFRLDDYLDDAGEIVKDRMTSGPGAPAVPGTVAGLYEAWRRFGSLPWANLVEPAVSLASGGIVVTNDLAFALAEAAPILARYPASKAAFLRADGTAYASGETLTQPDLAWSLQQIRDGGADVFYRGSIAERIATIGSISREDLDNYRVRIRNPVTGDYRGHRVISAPPVSSGGLTLVQMLNILEHFDMRAHKAGSAASLHLIAEAMKRSAANRRVGIGGPDYVDVPVDGFTSEALADKLAAQIDHGTATPVAQIDPADAGHYESRETTHFSVMDRHGNAVSNTYTLGYSFGSGYVVPGAGFLLDNQVNNFTYGKPGHANAIAPGKRMVSTMTPTIVLDKAGDVLLVTGTPGGSRIINVILQIILNVIDYDMNIAEATHAPRIHQQWRTPSLGVERGVGPDTIALLAKRGHAIEVQQTMGSSQSILFRGGLFYGASDPRRPGALALGVQHNKITLEK